MRLCLLWRDITQVTLASLLTVRLNLRLRSSCRGKVICVTHANALAQPSVKSSDKMTTECIIFQPPLRFEGRGSSHQSETNMNLDDNHAYLLLLVKQFVSSLP